MLSVHPVTHRRNPQGTLFFAPQFTDPVTPNRLRTIASLPQPPRQLFQVRFQVVLELGHRLLVHACGSVIGLHSRKGSPQSRQGANLVHQAVPLASLHSRFESRQHPFRPNLGFDPGPSSLNLSGGHSSFSEHSVRGRLLRLVRHVSTFLRSLRSVAVTPLLRYYGRSDSCTCALFSALPRRRGRLFPAQVSLIPALDLPTLPSPITCGCCVSSEHVTRRRITPRLLPHGTPPNGNSGLRLQLAGSPPRTGRIEFLIVRTGRSPPAAPHPVSPRRSCRLITSYVNSERTSTSRVVCALRRTSPGQRPGSGKPNRFALASSARAC